MTCIHSFSTFRPRHTFLSQQAFADSSFLLLFNMWPYALSFPPFGVGGGGGVHKKKWDCWQKRCEMLDFGFAIGEMIFIIVIIIIFFYFKKRDKRNILSYAHAFPNGGCVFFLSFRWTRKQPLGLMEFMAVSDRGWIGWRKWGGKRGIRSN